MRRRLLTGPVVSKHHIVRSEDAAAAGDLRLLNFDGLLMATLHEVVLARRVGSNRLPLVHSLGGLTWSHLHDGAVWVSQIDGSLAASNCALLGHEATTDTPSPYLTRSLFGIASLAKTASTLRLVCVYFGERAHWAALFLLRVRVHQTI